MCLIYNLCVTAYFILTLPYYLFQMARREKYRAGFFQRLGFYPDSVRRALVKEEQRIWFHAVSVGEVAAVMPLLNLMRKEIPDWRIVLSTVTLTGQRVAREKLGGVATVLYFPLDMHFAVRRALRIISPRMVVLVETEIWPNFINTLHAARIPIAIINGRISDRSFPGYRRGRFLLKRFLKMVSLFSMQTELDAERIKAIGAPSERVMIGGNMKFDCGLRPGEESARRAVLSSLGLNPRQEVIVAGSTHRGEEEILLDVLQLVKRESREAVLVIVPRHPERAEEVHSLAEARGERCILRSSLRPGDTIESGSVLIINTVGELVDVYRAATVVFVGKSLVKGGGQNIIEPASLGKPVLFGPSMENFREAAELLISNGGAVRVKDGRQLGEAIVSLLRDEGAREEMGRRAAGMMARSRGATRRNLEIIKKLLAGK